MGTRRGWPVPVALVALSAIPVAAGALRLVQLSRGPGRDPGRPPVPPASRSRSWCTSSPPPPSRSSGSFSSCRGSAAGIGPGTAGPAGCCAVAGLLVAISALWMTLFYAPQPGTGDLLYLLRLGFATAMAACLVLGVTRRPPPRHRRPSSLDDPAYAIGLAAGTQAFTEGIGGALLGTGEVRGDLAKGAGWVINLAVAEWCIRRNGPRT